MAIKWPLSGSISSPFGDTRNRPSPHSGTDIRGRNGDPIRAGATGRVHHTGYNTPASGNVVTIIYPVKGGNLYALYSHVEPRYPVRVGQSVTEGQVIAYSGTSGNTGGGHVHIECYLNGRLVNPEDYFAGTVPAGGDVTPIPTPKPERKKQMTIGYYTRKKTGLEWAVAGDSPGTPANWILLGGQQAANDYAAVIGNFVEVTNDRFDVLRDRYSAPVKVEGNSSVAIDYNKLATAIASALPNTGTGLTAAQIAKAVNEDAAARLKN